MAVMSDADRDRLAQAMDDRRRFLRLRWDDVAVKGSISYETLRQVRFGTGTMRALTKRGIEEALDWNAGSVDAILAGGEPDEQFLVGVRWPDPHAPTEPFEVPFDAAAEIARIARLDLPVEKRMAMVRAVIDLAAEANARSGDEPGDGSEQAAG